ncbi:MAG: N-6 DNA methylase [Candidatus Lokiarchaeota archaeon]|nr:N-6 DNA methylase [Candidatus Lokiarchaeota archaeon]
MPNIKHYLNRIRQNRATGKATEHTHRAALAELLEALREDVRAINEPTRIACGAPDLAVLRDGFMVGHVEAKDVGASLDTVERSEQLKRYRRSLENLVLTNYLEFRWYVDGELRRTVRLARLDARGEIKAEKSGDKNVADLLTDFLAHQPQPVTTPRELAERMARLTHLIREIIVTAFETDRASDLLTDWRRAFAEVLVADLDQPDHVGQFADMFAQTLAYGLFSARIRHEGGDFTRQKAQGLIPKTNPFLREFFSYITGVQLEDEPYAGLVEDLVQLLALADMSAILEDFGRRTRQDDPTVHFYETFLAAYDPDLRERRGVFFTPSPIVSFIVRSVDILLKEKFGLHDGLADTTKLSDGKTHKVLILDPAVGTATFPYHVIDLIRSDFMEKGNAGMWSGYVREHLLSRIFGFELLMAPYAVAHFKLALQLGGHDLPEPLREQWAYDFAADERLQIYLTNALERRIEEPPRLIGPTRIVTREAQAASDVKQDRPIMVVVGNPPYSVSSSNKGDHIEELMNRYKAAVRSEQNIQPLSDDYIKFIRFAHDRVERTGYGVVGMITNHSYLFGLIHRGMREELLRAFDEIYILNLHGSTLVDETTPDGAKDENVFDIRQGVAIMLMVRVKDGKELARLQYADLWGRRTNKYRALGENDVETLAWKPLKPKAPYYFFVPKDFSLEEEYKDGTRVDSAFSISSLGVEFGSKAHLLAVEREELEHFVQSTLLNSTVSDAEIAEKYGLKTTSGWRFEALRQSEIDRGYNPDHLVSCLEAPFNIQYTYYTQLLRRPQLEVLRNQLLPNVALLTARQSRSSEIGMFFATDRVFSKDAISIKDRATGFPLFVYPDESAAKLFDDTATSPWDPDSAHGNRVPNLSQDFVEEFAAKLDLTFDAHKTGNAIAQAFGPEDILAYIYAVFHSPTYRERYAEFLKIDFPRVPLTSDADLFWKLVDLGSELIDLHLMEHPKLAQAQALVSYPVAGTDRVKPRGGFPKFIPAGESRTKTSEVAEQNRVYINLEQYFAGVPEDVWEFEVGGYQVLHKWLKDRRGRKLSYDELRHYQQIVVALCETMRLMQQIDAAIPSWPME